jgi:hypothetical protein
MAVIYIYVYIYVYKLYHSMTNYMLRSTIEEDSLMMAENVSRNI